MHFNYFACATVGYGFAFHVDANDFSFSKQFLFDTENNTMKELVSEVVKTVNSIEGTNPHVDYEKAVKVLNKMIDDASKYSGFKYLELMKFPAYEIMFIIRHCSPFKMYR